MEYQLQLKPFEKKDGFKYKILEITDIAFHSTEKQPTKSIGRKIKQAFQENKPGRFYGLKTQEMMEGGNLAAIIHDYVQQDPNFIKMIQEEKKKGYKILLALPKEGIPFKLGDDTVEFLRSKNGQRVVRSLNKANN